MLALELIVMALVTAVIVVALRLQLAKHIETPAQVRDTDAKVAWMRDMRTLPEAPEIAHIYTDRV